MAVFVSGAGGVMEGVMEEGEGGESNTRAGTGGTHALAHAHAHARASKEGSCRGQQP